MNPNSVMSSVLMTASFRSVIVLLYLSRPSMAAFCKHISALLFIKAFSAIILTTQKAPIATMNMMSAASKYLLIGVFGPASSVYLSMNMVRSMIGTKYSASHDAGNGKSSSKKTLSSVNGTHLGN